MTFLLGKPKLFNATRVNQVKINVHDRIQFLPPRFLNLDRSATGVDIVDRCEWACRPGAAVVCVGGSGAGLCTSDCQVHSGVLTTVHRPDRYQGADRASVPHVPCVLQRRASGCRWWLHCEFYYLNFLSILNWCSCTSGSFVYFVVYILFFEQCS